MREDWSTLRLDFEIALDPLGRDPFVFLQLIKGREVTAYFNVDIPTESLRDALAN